MCVDSGVWNTEKASIAEQIGEMTQIWYVGMSHRETALCNGVTSWKDHRCTTDTMGLRGLRAPIIDAILDINRQNTDLIRPRYVKNNSYGWKKCSDDDTLFVDCEVINDIFAGFDQLPNQSGTDMIFMIGVGYTDNGEFVYRNFTCRSLTLDEEYRIMDEFVDFVISRGCPRLFHWVAESRFWYTASCRQFDRITDPVRRDSISDKWKICDWADLAQVFQAEPIVIKDCFKFGLKAIAGAMHKHGLIKTHLESRCTSGLAAMIDAWKTYQACTGDEILTNPTMVDIIKYNEFDCKVLWEILNYLKTHHVKQI
jgi:hypothetical protein